jgi:hypothetical protein
MAEKLGHELEPIGFSCNMTFCSVVPKNPGKQDGKYIGFYRNLFLEFLI